MYFSWSVFGENINILGINTVLDCSQIERLNYLVSLTKCLTDTLQHSDFTIASVYSHKFHWNPFSRPILAKQKTNGMVSTPGQRDRRQDKTKT